MEQVGRKGNVLFINDTKATNADAAAPALSSLPAHLLDRRRPAQGGRHRAAARRSFRASRKAYLIGEGGAGLRRDARRDGALRDLRHAGRRRRHAARDAARTTRGEPVVLLSPACASLRPVRNFEVRGDAFRAAVALDAEGHSASEGLADAQPRRPQSRRRLVVHGRPLVARGLPAADGARHHPRPSPPARRSPNASGSTASISSSARSSSAAGARRAAGRLVPDAARRSGGWRS